MTFYLSKKSASILKPVALVRLTQISNPNDLLEKFDKNDIIIEFKYDGWKTQILKLDNKVQIFSRRGIDRTANFPTLIKALSFLPNNTLIEGELLYIEDNKQEIGIVTSLAGSGPKKSLEKQKTLKGNLLIYFYDILWLKGKDVSKKPFFERRSLLEKTIKQSDKIKITKQYPFDKWQEVIKEAVAEGGEGIVLKIKDAPYIYKTLGEAEPKPNNTIFKYKGHGGKSASDDFVVYDYVMGEGGKLKALFGQFYKGKLYGMSKISNFSRDVEEEIKKKLKKGPFVIEIAYQEKIKGGLRSQRFVRMRDDKAPKDATMDKFHIEHIDNFDVVNKADDFILSKRASFADEVLQELSSKIKTKPISGVVQDLSGLRNIADPIIDVEKAYKIISMLESKQQYVIGDSGTAFGSTQVQFSSFVNQLARDPQTQSLTGLTPQQLTSMGELWNKMRKTVGNVNIWKQVPVDADAVKSFIKANPNSVISRREGTTIKVAPGTNPGVVKIVNKQFVGYELDLNVLQSFGLDVNKNINELNRLMKEYITDGVVRNGIVKLLVSQSAPEEFNKFKQVFSTSSVRSNQALKNLTDRATQRDFMNRVEQVVNMVKQYGYDTTAPGAYNIYQLIAISNASGVGAVQNFLKNKKPFASGNLHYLQRANKMIAQVTGLSSEFASNGGLSGFSTASIEINYLSKRAMDEEETTQVDIDMAMFKTYSLFMRWAKQFMNDAGFRKAITDKISQTKINKSIHDIFDSTIAKYIKENWEKIKLDSENVKYFIEYIDKVFDIDLRIQTVANISKRAGYTEQGVLYFPGQFAEDIKSGKKKMTIRAGSVPVEVSEVVKCMSYSGGHICDLYITSKETMSTNRIGKAYGDRVAKSLEQKFGIGKQFTVINFDLYEENSADDEDKIKMKEVFINKDGVKLTRKQIQEHYMKPEVRKKIMDRIKDNPILIYIGIGENQKVLKRNHDGKQIVITNDDKDKSESPDNYFYWAKRRLLSIHQVFGPKTDLGFVDLDIHGDFTFEQARKYAKELNGKIKDKFGVSCAIYNSGGTGIHVEFKLKDKVNINTLREELKVLLTEFNESYENVTTSTVKGSGMRSDISILHNKGSIRVPGSLGETYGKEKALIKEQAGDDDTYGNSNFGGKYSTLPENLDLDPMGLDTGAIVPKPDLGAALSKRDRIKNAKSPGVKEEYIWIWDGDRLHTHLVIKDEKGVSSLTHSYLADANGIDLINDEKTPRGYVTIYKNNDVEISTYGISFYELSSRLQNKIENKFDLTPGKYRITVINNPSPKFQSEIAKLAKKTILIISTNFNESERLIPKKIFVEKYGFNVCNASDTTLDSNKYDALFVVGGKDMIEFSKNIMAQKLLKSFIRQKKPIAMVGYAPLLGIEANIIKGREITGCQEIMGKVIRAKSIWTGMPIEKDGSIFTAIGLDDVENLAFVFANFINNTTAKMLNEKEAQEHIETIWKIAGTLEDDEKEWEKMLGNEGEKEEVEEEDEASRWLAEQAKKQPKGKFKPPRKTFEDSLKGKVPEKEETRDVTYDELFGPLTGEPKKEEVKDLIVEETIDSEKFKQIIAEYNKQLDSEGSNYHKMLLQKSLEDLKIILENEYAEADKTLEEEYYKQLVEKDEVLKKLPQEKVISELEKFKKTQKEFKQELQTGRTADEQGEQFAFDDALNEKKRKLAKPSFAKRIEPFKDEKGNISQSWPKIEIPSLDQEALEYFHPSKLNDGPSIREAFSNPKAWAVLKKQPELLQTWILPALIMTLGHRWFELNSSKESVGRRTGGVTFKYMQGGAPFPMLDDITNEESIKKLQSGEIEIGDLPEAKEYIQHVNRLIAELANAYFAKENPTIPIDKYIYDGLQHEMIRIIAAKHGYKRKHTPVCSICKMNSDERTEVAAMELIGKGLYKCLNCEEIVEKLQSNLKDAKEELYIINKKLSAYENAKTKLKGEVTELTKQKLQATISETESSLPIYENRKEELEYQLNDINEKIQLHQLQENVPYFHILCPNPKCKLQRIPLTSVNWEDPIWNTPEGDELKKNLKSKYQITAPKEQHAADVPIPSYIPKSLIPGGKLSWIYNVPFKCPYDGINFRMKDVITLGYKGMAGFFYHPYEKIMWQSSEEITKKMLEKNPQLDSNNKAPELSALKSITGRAQKLARQQYYEFYNYLRALDVALKEKKETFEFDGKEHETKALSKAQKINNLRELLLYNTISDFALNDSESYLNWLAGNAITNKPIYENGVVQNKNVVERAMSYTDKREQVYLPILQKWVDNMAKIPDFVKKFDLQSWLVNTGELQGDGSYSEDGIMSDGPGTYFIAKIGNFEKDSEFYGFTCNLESKRIKDEQYKKQFDSKGPRMLRVLDVWKINGENLKILTSAQKEGKDCIPKAMAEGLIKKTKENLFKEVKSHDYHNAIIDENTTLIPGDEILVRAFIMPGKFNWKPLLTIKETESNKRDYSFWQKFYELLRLKRNDPEYWTKFEKTVDETKPFLYDLESLIDREIFKVKTKKEASDPLAGYKKKRNFEKTKEPEGKVEKKNKHRFVIQDHDAEKAGRHFDLRLENNEGTMTSFAIPKHKLPTGKEKLLAKKVEDHTVSYNKFEGTIPEGEYGAGKVEIHDKGTYKEIKWEKDKIIFELAGKKENGKYNLIKTKDDNWLIMKAKEE